MKPPLKEGYRSASETEVISWWKCNIPGCGWKIKGTIPYWRALREFGEHNLEKHFGTSQAHVTSDKGFPSRNARK